MKTKIFVYIEEFKGVPIEPSLALLNYSNQIIKYRNRDDFSITALVFTQYQMTDDEKEFLYRHGADSIFNIVGKQFGEYSLSAQINAIKNAIKIECPDIFLFSTTEKQKEIAPYLATSLNAGLTADCTALEIMIEGGISQLLATRPTFGGKLMAQIAFKGYPNMATVRNGVSKPNNTYNFEFKDYKKFGYETVKDYHVKILESIVSPIFSTKLDPNSKLILSAGYGIGSYENFQKLEELAELFQKKGIKTSIGASRKAVESGFAPRELQVGQTGSFVSSDVYIMFGISGAVHHMIALEGVKKIIAINNDENSPIANQADVFIKAKCEDFIQKLIEKLSK